MHQHIVEKSCFVIFELQGEDIRRLWADGCALVHGATPVYTVLHQCARCHTHGPSGPRSAVLLLHMRHYMSMGVHVLAAAQLRQALGNGSCFSFTPATPIYTHSHPGTPTRNQGYKQVHPGTATTTVTYTANTQNRASSGAWNKAAVHDKRPSSIYFGCGLISCNSSASHVQGSAPWLVHSL